jgi:signal peptidase II
VRSFSIGWRIAYLVAASGIYLVDQMTKAWAVRELKYGESRSIIDNLLSLTYAENTGIAFGQFQGGGTFGKWFFATLAFVASVAVLIYLFRTTRIDDHLLAACAFLLAGISGNLTDRIRFGYVIDFIDMYIGQYHWPTFNIADASISTGAILLIYDMFVTAKREQRAKSSQGLQDGNNS